METTHLYRVGNEWGEVAVIILGVTGKVYSNQTGGIMCDHPEVEGTLYRLTLPEDPVSLHTISCEADENVIALLERCIPGFHADPAPQEEAWVTGQIGGQPCVVTYGNCD